MDVVEDALRSYKDNALDLESARDIIMLETHDFADKKVKDLMVKCGRLETTGRIVLGNLNETGNIPKEIDKIKIIDGRKYKLIDNEYVEETEVVKK